MGKCNDSSAEHYSVIGLEGQLDKHDSIIISQASMHAWVMLLTWDSNWTEGASGLVGRHCQLSTLYILGLGLSL